MLAPLLDAVPVIRQGKGGPRKRPDKLHADKGYDFPHCRKACTSRGIKHRIARRGIDMCGFDTPLGRTGLQCGGFPELASGSSASFAPCGGSYFFGGCGLALAWQRITPIMAKAGKISKTWPCRD